MLELHLVDDITTAEAIAQAEASCTPHPWSAAMYAESISGQDQVFAYNSASAQTIGYAVILQVLDEIQLQNIFISKPWQRQGYGRKLLQLLMELAAKQNCSRMLLEVRESNLAARELYLSCGFKETGLRKQYYRSDSGPRENAILMEASL
ncbi:ribosomal protein S18-alanine N-acetyltransferase [Vogesella oryzae]|uniref:ribosomal protein S18-alanine N-acetyltransferase n=1 Tax=Vogesella oryzae TaxID=1735285 RepID=UPI00158241DC|nr:ribosomal protein S18-alanine N-acetyltransferase [Vogesella oryzae]